VTNSIWAASLATFNSDIAGTQPSPAAGSAAAVSARLAVSLLIKVLEITISRKSIAGSPQAIDVLLSGARTESEVLAKAADEDGRAFAEYLHCVRKKADQDVLQSAMLRAIEVPMTAARSSLRAIALCRDAVHQLPAFIAADLGAAVLLLSGAVRALLITVDYNLQQLPAQRSDLAAERIGLENEAATHTGEILKRIRVR
jgi:formiminotetrahydrofolate cyclodeaminase